VTNRLLVFIIPAVVVLAYVVMAMVERRATADISQTGFVQRNGPGLSLFFVLAVGFWTLFMVTLPYLYMFQESFHPTLWPKDRGGPKDTLTLEHYRFFLYGSDGLGNFTHLRAFLITILVSLAVTVANFILCYPIAYYMAQSATPQKVRLLLLALIVPYWVNEILRAFALRVLLASSGLINTALLSMGLISESFDFLGANIGLYVGLSYAYLLLMVFPLYNAIESLDSNQIEAARDLGAPWWRIHRDIVIPHAKPGIASGCTMVFMLSAGALAAPQFLGGPQTLWFTSIVYDFFFQSFNWARGSAYALILLAACILFVMLMLRLFRVSLGEAIR
jgi:spermidine/putrescine transport system permease protein